MITIGHPFIEKKNQTTYLSAEITDTNLKKEYVLWYSVDSEYGDYFSPELADSFLLVMLPIAMSSHQDIKIDAPVSAKLLFNIKNSLMAMLLKVLPDSIMIKIDAKTADTPFPNTNSVGCGCSLGVDSFSSILKHLEKEVTPGYRITHFALFNTGQLGDLNLEAAEKDFKEKVERLKPFAKEIGLPLIAIDTNLNFPYLDSKVNLLQSYPLRTISAAVSLQKLFKRYIYASSYSAYTIEFTDLDIGHIESLVIPLLSTLNTEIILSNPIMTRVQKTSYISSSSLVRRYLDVCWAAQVANMTNNSNLLKNKVKRNCGKCDKCLRTLFTLELLGKIRDYEEIFDLNEYYKYRNKFIVKILSQREENEFYEEIFDLMNSVGFHVPIHLKIYSWGVRLGLYHFLQRYFKVTTMAH